MGTLIWVNCLPNELLRAKFLISSLFCMVCSCASVIIGTGWYARSILDDYINKSRFTDSIGFNEEVSGVYIFGNCLYVAWISLIFHLGAIVLFALVVSKGTSYNGKFDGGSSYGNYTRESVVSGAGSGRKSIENGLMNVGTGVVNGYGRMNRSLDKTQY